jgi:hypothetical protein
MANERAIQRSLYVASGGSDRNSGAAQAPFQTLERVRDAVREISGNMTGDILVNIAPGTYALNRTLTFDHRDSGTNGFNVIYRAGGDGPVVVSGGRRITGWQPDTSGRWKAGTDVANFRQLYVNGRRAGRTTGPAPRGLQQDGCAGYTTQDRSLASWKNIQDVEFCYQNVSTYWTHTRCRVNHIEHKPEHDYIHMAQPGFTLACVKPGVHVGCPDYIENALELLDEPGEWYLDRQEHLVYYYPRPGEEMQAAEVVAPALEVLVELKGTLDQPVRNIRFEGLTFAYATWLTPSDGFIDVQANFRIGRETHYFVANQPGLAVLNAEMTKSPANVICHATKAVQFQGCRFTHLGGAGLDLEYGAQDNVVDSCEFYDISGTGIQVGDVQKDDHHPNDARLIVKNNRVTNNRIHDIAVEYLSGVGIFAGYTEATLIAHNEIYDLPYSGISIGWGWGETDAGGGASEQPSRFDTPTAAKDNVIEFNHVHHVMLRLLDGGGIYTLGRMPGTVIRDNRIDDAPGWPGGICLDQGSGDIEVIRNVITGLKPWTLGGPEVVTPILLNNRTQDRDASCPVHDNDGDVYIHIPDTMDFVRWKA